MCITRFRFAVSLLTILLLAGHAALADEIRLYEGLGTYHRKVSTTSDLAQDYFDQGMNLGYAFGRPEAADSFKVATEKDPECAICYWGEAWTRGPYQNAKMSAENAPKAYAAIQRALENIDSASELEVALIQAMATRYAENPEETDREGLDRAYSEAMREVAARFPDDQDVIALFAESLMVLHPWDLYPDGQLRPEGAEAIELLEGVLEKNLRHAGACHLYIHAVEPSDEPQRAEACADVLAQEIPLGSHIQHMPSHIYMRIGRYADGVRANQQAHIVDLMAQQDKAVAIYAGHNLRMLWYAAWMDGQSAIAIQAGYDVAREGDWATSHLHQALARFGRWDELKQMNKAPAGKNPQAIWLFARGMAFLREGPRAKAEKSLRRLTKIMNTTDPEEKFKEGRKDGPIHLMRIAHGILAGEMAAADGDFDAAMEHLELAVEAADHLQYSEPERWAIPPRQVLGALLLQAGRPAEAQKRFEEELAKHPENGWSLYGLAESLRAQAREEEAAEMDERFRQAWARSDVFLTSSRF